MAIDPRFQRPILQGLSRFAATAVLAILVNACAAVPKPQPVPVPVPRPAPVPVPRPVPAPNDWRDAPQTPGDWYWRVSDGNSQASYGLPSAPVAMLTCDAASRTVVIARIGNGTTAMPMTVRSTFGLRPLSSDPAASKPGWIAVRLTPRDPLLDQIAFSRGRFTIEVAGMAPLYLPSWPEISRVIEDCR